MARCVGPIRSSLVLSCSLAAPAAAQITHHVGVADDGSTISYTDPPTISSNGRFVAWASTPAVYVRDRWSGTTEIASVHWNHPSQISTGEAPVIAGDGGFVAFQSQAGDLVQGDANGQRDVFVRDLATGVTELVSVSSSGEQGDEDSTTPSISSNGRYVLFLSGATNFATGATGIVYVRDRVNATTSLALPLSGATLARARLSGNGRFVAYGASDNALVSGDTNGASDVFVRDLQTGAYEILSRGLGSAQGNGSSGDPAISADGRFVAFQSLASNLVAGDTNGVADVFVRDRANGTTTRVSVADGGGQLYGVDCGSPALSPEGDFAAFVRAGAVLRVELQTWSVVQANVSNGGTPGTSGSGPSLSDGGTRVAFASEQSYVILGYVPSVYVRDFTLSCGMPETYCTPKVNSLGCEARMWADGVPSLSNFSDLVLRGVGLVHQTSALLFYGFAPASAPFHGGHMCVQPPSVRLALQNTGGNAPSFPGACEGEYFVRFDPAFFASHGIGAGVSVYAQVWGRDSGFPPPNNVQLTDGLTFTTCP